jgi:hypothetical protein
MYNNAMYKSFNCIRFHLYNLFIVVENLDLFAYNKIFVTGCQKLNFLFILKVANIRCFILIKCSEQKARFKKSVIMS